MKYPQIFFFKDSLVFFPKIKPFQLLLLCLSKLRMFLPPSDNFLPKLGCNVTTCDAIYLSRKPLDEFKLSYSSLDKELDIERKQLQQ